MSLAPASANEVGDAKDGERLLADIEHGGASSDAAEAHSGEREVVVQSRKQYAKDWKRPFLFANPTSSSTDGEFSKASVWLLIVFYIGLNCALNLTNRYALGMTAFNFPISLTCTHMLFSFVVLAPYFFTGARREQSFATLKRSWKGICCIGFFLALNISLNNASLVGMTLVLNQIVRSGIPVVTAIFAVFIEGKVPTISRAVGLVPICLGVVCSIYEGSQMDGTIFSLVLCIAGMISNALMMTISGRVMEEKIDAIQLACFTAPVSLAVLVYHFGIHEADRLVIYMRNEPHASALVLIGTSILALSYNIVHYQVIRATSAVTTTVLGNVKIVLIVLLSGFLFGETASWTVRMVLGAAITLVGFFIYSWAGLEEKLSASRAKRETLKS